MAAENVVEVADVAEDVVELVEDTADLVEGKLSWLKTTNAKLFLVGVSAFALGGVASYAIFAKRLSKKYQKIADEQVDEVKAHYSVLYKADGNNDLEALAARYQDEEPKVKVDDILRTQGYKSYNEAESNEDTTGPDTSANPLLVSDEQTTENPPNAVAVASSEIVQNVFESDDPDRYFNMEEELEKRRKKPDQAFVITLDEFNENEDDLEQTTLTYFEGDEVLVDERDEVIPDEDSIVGPEALLRFGHGSNDRNVVYVRNNRIKMLFEVLKSEGKYAEEVMGFIEHAEKPGLRKFRNYD